MDKLYIYGIPNCDSTRKAINWLKTQKVNYTFYDFKMYGINKPRLEEWCRQVGWGTLLNKKSTTWRSLSALEQAAVTNEDGAIKTMMNHNSIIKRPVIEFRKRIFIGIYKNEDLKTILLKK
jgi:Spx/MgsR family transcriptional regulator